jgi:ribonuclease Y
MGALEITSLVAALALGLGGGLGWFLNNRFGRRSVEAARARSEELMRTAQLHADRLKRAKLLEAREEILRQRHRAERELRSRKRQYHRRERELEAVRLRLEQGEAALAERREELEQARAELAARDRSVGEAVQQADRLVEEQNARLEKVSGMTQDEARRQLLENLKARARFEAAEMIKEIKDEAQRNAEREAVKILALAVERAASDFSAERTVSQFELPGGSDLKGRIIGQEGKNIRAFEKATGIQLLIDEASNTITLSGYNPVGRELARRVLENLIQDGSIHPRRIEELVRRHRRRLDEEMRQAGQESLRELRIRGVHPELVKLLGRLKYRTSYGQNVLQHSMEVAYLTGMMAAELRLDEKLARRAGLLHDIGKAIDYEREGTHPEIGAEVAQKYGEPEVVINAIASHHEDCEVTTPISVLVSAADALSGARPGARRKGVAEYLQRIERLEELANSMEGVEQSYALHAGREIRVIARSKIVDDAQVELLASDLASRIQSEMDYPGRIKVTVIRETRAVDYAR